MTHRRLTVSCLSLLLLTAGITLLPACSSQSAQQGQAQGPQELPVRTLSAGDFSANNSYPAVIRGEDDAEIRPKVSGFITKVYVTEGQSVKVTTSPIAPPSRRLPPASPQRRLRSPRHSSTSAIARTS